MATLASFTFGAGDAGPTKVFFGGFLKQWQNYTREGFCDKTIIRKHYPDQQRVVRVGGGGISFSGKQLSLTSAIPLLVSRLEGQSCPGMSLAGDLTGQEQEKAEPALCLSPICSS